MFTNLNTAAEDFLTHPRHFIGGGVYAKELVMLKAGSSVEQHIHKHDHLSLLACGRVSVTADGNQTVYTGPTAIIIRAGISHKIEALTDNVLWYCVHAIPENLKSEGDIDAALIIGSEKALA